MTNSVTPGATMSGMADDDWYKPDCPLPPPRKPSPGQFLWELVRESDRKHFRCELRFHGESYGWEVQIFESGDFIFGHGAFVTRALAEQYATETRKVIERGPDASL
jgi:hypothetical protein